MPDNRVTAYLDDYDSIVVIIDDSFYGGKNAVFRLTDDDGTLSPLTITSFEVTRHHGIYKLFSKAVLYIGRAYYIIMDNGHRAAVQYRFIVKTPRFNADFYYDGTDLGALVKDGATSFAVWAPTASRVILQLTEKKQDYEMVRGDKGVWRYTLAENADGQVYNYLVCVNGQYNRTPDPYGHAASPNGVSSVVCDLAPYKVDPDRRMTPFERYSQAVIYEASVRDSCDKATFADFAGQLDRIKKLGITHLQLLPVTAYATCDEYHTALIYNWGYDPSLPQCLSGCYSSDVNEPTRVLADFADLIRACHKADIRVNLDMVFNHVYSADDCCFSKIVPFYYLRYTNNQLSNGSLCGNDFDSGMVMARKFIIDTVSYYTSQFDVDGFRLDLMGILDAATVDKLINTLKTRKPDIMIYGEGWKMPTSVSSQQLAIPENRVRFPYVAFFNDQFRDEVRGNVFDITSSSYFLGDLNALDQGQAALSGQRWDDCEVSINYAECHDNGTLYDKLSHNESEENAVFRQKLIGAAVILAQGIPFIHSGQEFCRTKYGLTNTYNAPDRINHLDAGRMKKYQDVTAYYTALISLRRQLGIGHNKFEFHSQNGLLAIRIDGLAGGRTIIAVFNPAPEAKTYRYDGLKKLLLNADGLTEQPLDNEMTVAGISAAVGELL